MIQQPNNNTSVLPFYGKLDLQNARKSYAYGAIFPLITPADFILPFQVMRPTRSITALSVFLFDKTGKQVANITQGMKESGLQIVRFEQYGYDVIVYPGTLPFSSNMMDGTYYLRIYDGVQIWYSDMFTAVQDTSGYTKIEWYDMENMLYDGGIIVYDAPKFKNRLYLCTEIGKPDYEFEEEGETRDGYFFPEKQISEKTYRFQFLAPEYLCDVMRLIRMSDYVTITDKYGRVYHCDTFLITPKWQTQGDLASVEAEFQTSTVVKKIGRGYIISNKGDYNEDFNNDFDNN